MTTPDDDDESEDLKNARRWDAVALCLGYNELARTAKLLGENVYFRLARDVAQKRVETLGGMFDINEDQPILTLDSCMPHVRFAEKDIELMRQTVREYDERRTRYAP
jgi:hypothetical protein